MVILTAFPYRFIKMKFGPAETHGRRVIKCTEERNTVKEEAMEAGFSKGFLRHGFRKHFLQLRPAILQVNK
jgi:hypothetical protein